MPEFQIESLLSKLRQISDVRQAETRLLNRHPRVTKGSVLDRHFANPYTLQPVTGKAFYGRQTELRDLISNLRDAGPGRAILLWGPRRIGKTSLLREFQSAMGSDDYVVAFVDMQRLSGRSTLDFLLEIIRSIVEALNNPTMQPPRRTRMKRNALDYFRGFLENVPVLQEKELVLIFDEFQLLNNLNEEQVSLGDINHFFRSLIQHRSSLSIIFSGGGVLDKLLHQPQASFMLEVVRQQKVNSLDETAARQLIVDPVPHIQYSPTAVEWLLELTNGHPYYLQLFCGELIKRAGHDLRPKIDCQQIEDLLGDWLPYQGEQFFSNLWGSAIGFGADALRRHRLVLTAIAEFSNPEGWTSFARLEQSQLTTVMNGTELWQTLRDLVKMDTLHERYNDQYRIKVSLFEMWLLKNDSLDQLLRGL